MTLEVLQQGQKKLVDAFLALRERQSPSAKDPKTQALVNLLYKTDAIEEEQKTIRSEQTQMMSTVSSLEDKVIAVQVQHRNGVPLGHLSKKQAHFQYAAGISADIFHLAMGHLKTPTLRYYHTSSEGYETASTAYREGAIESAMWRFLQNSYQESPKYCRSPMLGNKRFKYVKGEIVAPVFPLN